MSGASLRPLIERSGRKKTRRRSVRQRRPPLGRGELGIIIAGRALQRRDLTDNDAVRRRQRDHAFGLELRHYAAHGLDRQPGDRAHCHLLADQAVEPERHRDRRAEPQGGARASRELSDSDVAPVIDWAEAQRRQDEVDRESRERAK